MIGSHVMFYNVSLYVNAVTQFPFAMCVCGGGAVDNNSYEWLLKSKNESE